MKKLHIIMYHYIRELPHSRYQSIKGLDLHLFIQQVKFLKQHFHIITMEDVLEAFESNKELPDHSALLTFDDGYMDHFTNVFPILKNEGVQGSFFISGKTFAEHKLLDVNKVHFILASADKDQLLKDVMEQTDYYRTDFNLLPADELFRTYAIANRFDSKQTIFIKRMLQTILPEELRHRISSSLFQKYVGVSEETFAYELYMDERHIRCMKDAGMHIGLHGYDHYWLGNLSEEQMQRDIDQALQVMDCFLDKQAWVMNYPYGSFNDGVIRYIAQNGCKMGLSTEVRVADLKKDHAYALPRLDTNDFPPVSEAYEKYGEMDI